MEKKTRSREKPVRSAKSAPAKTAGIAEKRDGPIEAGEKKSGKPLKEAPARKRPVVKAIAASRAKTPVKAAASSEEKKPTKVSAAVKAGKKTAARKTASARAAKPAAPTARKPKTSEKKIRAAGTKPSVKPPAAPKQVLEARQETEAPNPAAEPLSEAGAQPFPFQIQAPQKALTQNEPVALVVRLQEEASFASDMPAPQERLQDETPSKLVLMVRDPEWLYAYWEITSRDRERHEIGMPQGAPPLLLRVFGLGAKPEAAMPEYFDLTVIDSDKGWYVRIPRDGGYWRGALGYIGSQGEFVRVCDSNTVLSPGVGHADWTDERAWGPVGKETGEAAPAREMEEERSRIGSLQTFRAGRDAFVSRSGAGEQVPVLKGGASEQAARGPGGGVQAAIPASGLMREQPSGKEEAGRFRLQVWTELVLYGETEPDAQVTVQGNPVELRPDGTFTLRFAMPDGEQVIPVRAISAKQDESRVIIPMIAKKTI
jgi:uncharacterized protein